LLFAQSASVSSSSHRGGGDMAASRGLENRTRSKSITGSHLFWTHTLFFPQNGPIAEMPIFDDGAEASTLAGNLGMRTRGTENE
jgi:hypothetical protein